LNALVLKLLIGGSILLGAVVYILHLQGTIADQKATISQQDDDILILKRTISEMTNAQNNQTTQTEKVVTKIVKGPETVRTIVKEVQATPIPQACTTPDYPQDVKDSF